jgi:hypothetical protein
MEDVVIFHSTLGPFYSLLLYFMDFWCSSWYFGIFSCFGIFYQEKSGNPDRNPPASQLRQCVTPRQTRLRARTSDFAAKVSSQFFHLSPYGNECWLVAGLPDLSWSKHTKMGKITK